MRHLPIQPHKVDEIPVDVGCPNGRSAADAENLFSMGDPSEHPTTLRYAPYRVDNTETSRG